MPTTVKTLWEVQKSGVAVPKGRYSDHSQSDSLSYLAIKEKALSLEELYRATGVNLPSSCDLAGLIRDAKALSDFWLTDPERANVLLLFRAAQLDRVADAVLPLEPRTDRATFLKALTSGCFDFLKRQQSTSKNTFWELELWSTLKRRSFNADLCEPDIAVDFQEFKIGIACKKIYSEKHVQNVLSKAVSQAAGAFDFGIAAINLDELAPPDAIFQAPTEAIARGAIQEMNRSFLDRHDRHFRKYLSSGRIIAALVCTTVLAELSQHSPSFNTFRQATLWTIPGLATEKAKAIKMFYERLMTDAPSSPV